MEIVKTLKFALIGLVFLFGLQNIKAQQAPNIILIMTDDQGYRDLGSYGYGPQKLITPNLDALAKNGRKFTNYYAASNVCTPSRAGLLTGCYPQRIGMEQVLFSKTGPAYIKGKNASGLNAQEQTIASLLRSRGYATAVAGKWHLGYQKEFLPLQHGFEEFYGIPYSHDMIPETDKLYPPLPLIKGNDIIHESLAIDTLTKTFTDYSVDFINRNKTKPFFLYLAYSMPHVPLAVSKPYVNITKKGLYADVIYELDASVGRIMQTLKKNGLDKNTIVIFTSDNGPWLRFGNHSGLAYGLKEGKGTTYDGGSKVPFVVAWPGKIAPNTVCEEPLSGVDVLPTLVAISQAKLPKQKIDGKNVSNLLFAKKPKANTSPIYFFSGMDLQAVRKGNYKYHFKHSYDSTTVLGNDGAKGKSEAHEQAEALYQLKKDPAEKNNLLKSANGIATALKTLGTAFQQEIEKEKRPNGKIQP